MDLGLEGRSALVLGGTRGLGWACAQALAQAGVQVVVNGRDAAHGEQAARQLPGGRYVAGDIGDTDVYGAQQHAPLLDVEIPIDRPSPA